MLLGTHVAELRARVRFVSCPNLFKVMEELKLKIKESIKTRIERIPLIKRGTPVPNYYTTSDERILEYDFDKIVFEEKSKYQHVKILHSPTLGNCLLLDDLQNLAEKDINYTHGLMKYPSVSYADKEVLILGGGDGGLLCEHWDFIKKIVTMGLAVLRVNGLFLNHAIGVSCPSALETYEELLKELPFKLTFSKHTAHVPSFMEEYPSLTLSHQLFAFVARYAPTGVTSRHPGWCVAIFDLARGAPTRSARRSYSGAHAALHDVTSAIRSFSQSYRPLSFLLLLTPFFRGETDSQISSSGERGCYSVPQ
ncbi:hypothetical protein HPB51_010333 [Rhipicephalus microplus]|uniref:PABS domain-containing protein n=1 Tax=Rhipicephalus microplus TaxID=6941 RepID=A0A9J6DFQ7_RHIMP|nr:hypothetical protein HPB51_010333 [Rhipicephalus microplus]